MLVPQNATQRKRVAQERDAKLLVGLQKLLSEALTPENSTQEQHLNQPKGTGKTHFDRGP